MIDLIIVTKDLRQWHRANMAVNWKDYSFVARMFPSLVPYVNAIGTAKCYFNTNIWLQDRKIKYGVICEEDLKRDCEEWTAMYIAGRLHKPVLNVASGSIDDFPESLTTSVLINRKKALEASLHQLHAKHRSNSDAVEKSGLMTFTMEQLLEAIVGLSYLGDIRCMVGAEDPRKVTKIVSNQCELLEAIYRPLLDQDKSIRRIVNGDEEYFLHSSSQMVDESNKFGSVSSLSLRQLWASVGEVWKMTLFSLNPWTSIFYLIEKWRKALFSAHR